jgi:isochorismate hydrolase
MHFDATRTPRFDELAPPDRDVVLMGAEAHVCVLQTALGLRARGDRVFVIADAVGSRRASDREAGLARMAAEGCKIVTAEMVVFEWLDSCANPKFRDVLALLR